MKLHVVIYKTLVPLTCILLLSTSCCPSGPWRDNLGVTYQLLTDPFHPEGDSLPIVGVADTGELGCGLLTVTGTSLDTGTDRSVQLLVINPEPNQDDQCCYSFQFNGHIEGRASCRFIPGQFETNDGKCTQSGEMYLLSLR